jgi:xylan 1,4-beta-xylosidase
MYRRMTATLCFACILCACVVSSLAQPPASQPQNPVAIQVDLGKSLGPYKPIGDWFGYDESTSPP